MKPIAPPGLINGDVTPPKKVQMASPGPYLARIDFLLLGQHSGFFDVVAKGAGAGVSSDSGRSSGSGSDSISGSAESSSSGEEEDARGRLASGLSLDGPGDDVSSRRVPAKAAAPSQVSGVAADRGAVEGINKANAPAAKQAKTAPPSPSMAKAEGNSAGAPAEAGPNANADAAMAPADATAAAVDDDSDFDDASLAAMFNANLQDDEEGSKAKKQPASLPQASRFVDDAADASDADEDVPSPRARSSRSARSATLLERPRGRKEASPVSSACAVPAARPKRDPVAASRRSPGGTPAVTASAAAAAADKDDVIIVDGSTALNGRHAPPVKPEASLPQPPPPRLGRGLRSGSDVTDTAPPKPKEPPAPPLFDQWLACLKFLAGWNDQRKMAAKEVKEAVREHLTDEGIENSHTVGQICNTLVPLLLDIRSVDAAVMKYLKPELLRVLKTIQVTVLRIVTFELMRERDAKAASKKHKAVNGGAAGTGTDGKADFEGAAYLTGDIASLAKVLQHFRFDRAFSEGVQQLIFSIRCSKRAGGKNAAAKKGPGVGAVGPARTPAATIARGVKGKDAAIKKRAMVGGRAGAHNDDGANVVNIGSRKRARNVG